MSEFIWRKLKTVEVPEAQGLIWTPALDYLIPKRMYRLRAISAKQWTLDSAPSSCPPDGYDIGLPRNADPLCNGSPFGALIAKVGGGTADRSGIIFAVGRYCIYQPADDSKTGPLYLGANDLPSAMSKVTGQIEVEIDIAL
jgi:hypothetical protein